MDQQEYRSKESSSIVRTEEYKQAALAVVTTRPSNSTVQYISFWVGASLDAE